MNKIMVSVLGLMALAGCSSYYDYYQGGVRYTQNGTDCIYYSGEYANNFTGNIGAMNNGKKIVYRNTMCADLYARDNMGNAPRHDRVAIVPAAREVPATPVTVEPVLNLGCNTCGAPVLKRKYIIVPAM
ncbi:MAG: hypothetical protein K2L95_02825 [Alphaproteobacteria bacterium]|nr:hypothetical protein [Alphaproteobacteria bacterium]MDE6571124.1 hypothetical protein [Alphaproteobacteria bacterium]